MWRGFAVAVVAVVALGDAGPAMASEPRLTITDARAAVSAYNDHSDRIGAGTSRLLGCNRRAARRVTCRVRTTGGLLNPEEGADSPKMLPSIATIHTALKKPRLRRVRVWHPDYLETCVWQPERRFRCVSNGPTWIIATLLVAS
jgi:hypothetical protein